jgi:hypothetical protein
MSALELIGSDQIRINGRFLHLNYVDPPLEDGTVYCLTLSANPYRRHVEHFDLQEFHSVRGRDLPAGFSMTLEDLRTTLNSNVLVTFDNLAHGPEASLALTFSYVEWHLPGNLADFLESYKRELEQPEYGVSRVTLSRSEQWFYMTPWTPIAADELCARAFGRLDEASVAAYRKALQRFVYGMQQPGTAVTAPAPDAKGFKWWLRFIIVPIVTSTSFVTAITAIVVLVAAWFGLRLAF